MFEFIRTHQRLMQFFLLILVAPLFIIGGLQVGHFGESETAVAKVGDKVISQQELDMALREQDPRTYALPGIKKDVLDQLIAERALNIEAVHDHVYPSAREKQAFILKNFPSLGDASLSKEDRAKLYGKIAASQNMTIAGLETKIADLLIFQRLAGEIQSTSFVPKSVTDRITDILEQEREIQKIDYKTADFTSQVKVTDDMLKAYYSKHLAQFQNPEQAKIEYVVLSVNDIASQMSVSDAEANKFYLANQKRYTVEEQRRASHILIKVDKAANDTVRTAAKAKAEKLLAEVRKTPSDFSKLAKENSDDPGSAARGGDLDFFGKGMMVKPFQDSVEKLKINEISDLVQSDYGYHIIMLTGIKSGEIKSFETVKPEILTELKKQAAAKKFADLRETFTNTVYEQADSLQPVVDKLADKVKLKVETASVTRKSNPEIAPTVAYNNQKFLTAVFSDDAIKNKHNTEAISILNGDLISGRVTDYKSASQKPFEEVQALVREAVTQAEARNFAQKAAEAKLIALKTKDDTAGFGEAQTISRTSQAGLNSSIFQTIIKADAGKLPVFIQVELPGQGYSLFRINKVSQPAKPDPAHRAAIQEQLGRALSQQEMLAYVEVLKQKAKVKILRPDVLNSAPMVDVSDSEK